ncbi:MAG: sulfite exporter TauE/SafE family protein [Pseudomonadota bacterium]
MISDFASALGLTSRAFLTLVGIAFAAGLVRGFTGFALSALVMASAALILPPVELIPMLWFMEIAASVLMVKGGWAEADRRIALGLVVGSAVGVPIGLALTVTIDPHSSRLVALCLLVSLALLQLGKVRIAGLATTPGLYLSGVTAGIATGLAGIGGMVVALYVLAQDKPARVMRASLVLFLFGGSLVSLVTHLAYGTMDTQAAARGVAFALPTVLGVILGMAAFTPRFERWYKPICLVLLIGLSLAGIIRLVV